MTRRPFALESIELSRTQLVEASAGTGKTYAISTLVVRLLLETEWTIDQILVVTFTEAATAELKERIRRRIKDALSLAKGRAPASEAVEDLARLVAKHSAPRACERLEAALREFDNAAISTIHGFCQRVLQENSFASGVLFNAELVRDPRPLIDEVVLDFWAREVGPASRGFVEHLRDNGFSPDKLRSLSNWVAQTPLLEVVPDGLLDSANETERSGDLLRHFGDLDLGPLSFACEAARALFEPESILSAIDASDLKRTRYRRDYLLKWCAQLEQMFGEGRVVPRLPDQFDKFTTESLQAESRSGVAPEHAFFAACDVLKVEVEKVRLYYEQERRRFLARLIQAAQQEFTRIKRERGLYTFDDLLHGVYLALRGPLGAELEKSLRARFPVALIDEFQDTDPLQYDIFRRIYVGKINPLFLIGDPKQAIYSFRGADVFAYMNAASSIREERSFTMSTNYRSDARLVEAINLLFRRTPQPFFFDRLSYIEVHARRDAEAPPEFPAELGQGPLVFRFLSRDGDGKNSFDKGFRQRELPALVAQDVAQLLGAGIRIGDRPLGPKDIAILTRTNEQAFHCQAALQALRIPSVVLGDRSVFEYSEARELQLFLAAVLEPQNSRTLRAALTTEMLGQTVADLARIEQDEAEWDRWAGRLRDYNQRWASEGFVQMMRLALDQCAISERLLALVDGERRMTNLLHLIELLHVESTTEHLGPTGLYHYLAEQRGRVFAQRDDEQIRLESDEDTVKLTTVHKSKGLEYGVVFCPYLFHDFLVLPHERDTVRYHDQERGGVLTLDLGTTDHPRHLELMADEALAENLRLLYVALTRAKHRLVVFWGAILHYEESALAYLLHGGDVRSLTGEPNREQIALHVKGLGDEALLARLRELVEQQPGISVVQVDREQRVAAYQPAAVHRGALAARTIAEPLVAWQRTASFTELAREDRETHLGAAEGRDHDEDSALTRASTELYDRARLADFPGGARAGNFFHALLEKADFGALPALETFDAELHAFGYEPGELSQLARDALLDVVHTELQDGLSLADIDNKKRLNEMEFYLPTPALPRRQAGGQSDHLITPKGLAVAFAKHPSPQLPVAYHSRLNALRFMPVSGFLKGFIDLVFEHEGRFYVLDYKTNHLGDCYEDYGMEAMTASMSEHHYFLQYHLYSLAVHRWLSLVKRDYDYERDFGGVFYLFLRGMRPRSNTGVFYEKPPLSRMQALSSVFGEEYAASLPLASGGAE